MMVFLPPDEFAYPTPFLGCTHQKRSPTGVKFARPVGEKGLGCAMGLTGALSNPEVTGRLQCLTATRDWHEVRHSRKPTPSWSDGRRPFGTVGAAIVQVLSEADSDLRVKDIQAGVKKILNSPISRSSIKGYLYKDGLRRAPRFEHLGWGRYRLLSGSKLEKRVSGRASK